MKERTRTDESSERKTTSLPVVMERSSPSCDFSMLVMGWFWNDTSCVCCSVRKSHHLPQHDSAKACAEKTSATHRMTLSSPILMHPCRSSSHNVFLIVPSCAVAPPSRLNSSTPSVALTSLPSRGARDRSHSRNRFSWPPVRTRSVEGRGEGASGLGEGGEASESESLERSAVRTMCE